MGRFGKIIISLLTLASLLPAASSCMKENDSPSSQAAFPEGEAVRISFSLSDLPAATRALGEETELKSLYLAVFGSSGYLKEYVQAFPVMDGDSDHYKFTATLSLAEGKREVHLIGNGPATLSFGYADNVLPHLMTEKGEMAFWQVLEFPDGIGALRDGEGNYIREDGIFVADSQTSDIFAGKDFGNDGIPLIRNWGKIVLSEIDAAETSNFKPKSFAVVNTPESGTIVPYSAATNFISDYHALSFSDLENRGYPGNLPSGSSFSSSVPSKDDFIAVNTDSGVTPADGGAVYLYERPAPEDGIPPSYVIIYGHYSNPEDPSSEGDYFYKVDLMEGDRYYPIYRNFKYQIIVRKITARGHDTPQAAAAAAGSADVSADINTSHLSDISDGELRLAIQPWMAKTFTKQQIDLRELSVIFFDNLFDSDPKPDMDQDAVTLELLAPSDGRGNVIEKIEIAPPSEDESELGWRHITFSTIAPSSGGSSRTQTLRITGRKGSKRLYRDILITVQSIQPMLVNFGSTRVAKLKGEEQSVDISIPTGLPESMFPLEFQIEADGHTLTPDNSRAGNNLPLALGESISETPGREGKDSYHFIRTLDWTEYRGLSAWEDDQGRSWKTFRSYFKTNCIESATTVWVENEYFDKGSNSFTNYLTFHDVRFTTPIRLEKGSDVGLHFNVVEENKAFPAVRLLLINLVPDSGSGLVYDEEDGCWLFDAESASIDLALLADTEDGDVAVTLMAEGYEPVTLEPFHFSNVGFVDAHNLSSSWPEKSEGWSNVVLGRVNSDNGKNILFAYCDDPKSPNAAVTMYDLAGVKTNQKFPYTPTGPFTATAYEYYHEISMSTVSGQVRAEGKLSATGYVEASFSGGRFKGNINTSNVKLTDALTFRGKASFSVSQPSFEHFGDNRIYSKVSFSEISAINTSAANGPVGVVLDAGSTCNLTIESENANWPLFYIELVYVPQYSWFGAVRDLMPRWTLTEDGGVWPYMGNSFSQIITPEEGSLSVSVDLVAYSDYPIVLTHIVIKSFNGTFID